MKNKIWRKKFCFKSLFLFWSFFCCWFFCCCFSHNKWQCFTWISSRNV